MEAPSQFYFGQGGKDLLKSYQRCRAVFYKDLQFPLVNKDTIAEDDHESLERAVKAATQRAQTLKKLDTLGTMFGT